MNHIRHKSGHYTKLNKNKFPWINEIEIDDEGVYKIPQSYFTKKRKSKNVKERYKQLDKHLELQRKREHEDFIQRGLAHKTKTEERTDGVAGQ